MPAVTLGKSIAPFERIERFHETAVFIPASHQQSLLIKKITVILGTPGIEIYFLLRSFQGFRKLVNGKVVVCIFEGACRIFIYFYVIRHITKLVIVLHSRPANSGKRTCIICAV